MNILDKMHVDNQRVNHRRHEDPYGVKAKLSIAKMDDVQATYNGFTYEQAYKTEFRAATMWYANDAQFIMRHDIARKELLYFIYGPVMAKLNSIKARAFDRDWEAVHRLIDELEKELLD